MALTAPLAFTSKVALLASTILAGHVEGGVGKYSLSSAPPPEVEAINIATAASSDNLDISSINGVNLNEFGLIMGWFDGVANGGSNVRCRLSSDGITYRAGAADYRRGENHATTADALDDHSMVAIVHANDPDGMFYLWGMGAAAPTVFTQRDLDPALTAPARRVGYSSSAVVDTHVRFYTTAASNWTAGTLYLVGIRFSSVSVQSFSPSGETSQDFNIPAGHSIASIIIDDVTTSSTDVDIQVGTGGVFQETAGDYYLNFINDAADGVSTTAARFGATESSGTAAGIAQLYGFRASCPLWYHATQLDSSVASPSVLNGRVTNIAAYDQVRFKVDTGTMSGGAIYLVTFPADVEVAEHDFTTAGAAATHNFLSLGNYPIFGIVGESLTLASAGGVFAYASSDNGASWDSGATDYAHNGFNTTFDDANQRANFEPGPGSLSNHGFVSTFGGFGIASAVAHMLEGSTMETTTGPITDAGVRRAQQACNALQLWNDGGGNFTGGSLWRVGFKPA